MYLNFNLSEPKEVKSCRLFFSKEKTRFIQWFGNDIQTLHRWAGFFPELQMTDNASDSLKVQFGKQNYLNKKIPGMIRF